MTNHKDPNREERLRKEFQRKGDYIHTNNSLWSALITLNGIIIAIATLAPVCKTQIILIVIFCSVSIMLLVINFFATRGYVFDKIQYLNSKNRGQTENETENNQNDNDSHKDTFGDQFHRKIRINAYWKEILALVFSGGAFIIAMLGIINSR